jgi:uncharacterized protein
MSIERRFVFDTNALVSALLFEQSVPANAFFAAAGLGDILLSRETFTELRDVLGRTKFDRYLTPGERQAFLQRMLDESTVVEIIEMIAECRDPRDDKFLELAVCGKASCIVSGDQDLLVLNPFRGIPILTPADFLATLPRVVDNEK